LAFGCEEEAQLVEAMRQTPGHIPELSLVAEHDGRIIGHILLSPIVIETADGSVSTLSLAPMAVRPEFQRRGVGSALVRAGLEAARRLGHESVIVLGHADYYPRFGFVPARPRGIEPPLDVPDEAFMLIELVPGALAGVRGTVRFPPEYDVAL
jgi:putative acetyltransferase